MTAFNYFLTAMVVVILTLRISTLARKSEFGVSSFDISLVALGTWTVLVLIVRGIAAVIG